MALTEPVWESTPRILIVDDDSVDCESLVRALSSTHEGYGLLTATDGAHAQQILAEEKIDIVITDVEMPDLTGLELLQWARLNCPGPTWIILTGQATLETAAQAVRLGAFDFLLKSTELAQSLPITVQNALRQRSLEAKERRLREKLVEKIESLGKNVSQLETACRLLCDQAETIGKDMRRAELIQRALLPNSAPSLKGVAVNAIYRPSSNVGGDLYDVVQVADRYLVTYVADAAGHGVSAAMLSVIFKHRLQMVDELTGQPSSPAVALAAINRYLLADGVAPGLFITAAYCVLDTSTRELTITSAGHPPVAIRHTSGHIEWLHHTGPALGLSRSAQFAEHKTQLLDGEWVLFHTDGLWGGDVTRKGLAEELIVAALKDKNWLGEKMLASVIEGAARERGEGLQEDDITILLLRGSEAISTLDNSAPQCVVDARALPTSKRTQILFGSAHEQSAISIEGSGKWSYCAAFYEACMNVLRTPRSLLVDVSLCHSLDSTFLGTIQEVVGWFERERGELHIQGVLPPVRGLFEELGMDRVIEHITPDTRLLPTNMRPLPTSTGADPWGQLRILRAHEALASLNVKNRAEFEQVIQGVRLEMERIKGRRSDPV
jgi:serine phosphatase RsbU (regulator of sigma subunit)/anti-anti-sigma regulatory factor